MIFVCAVLFLVSSCAKKQVNISESAKPPVEEAKGETEVVKEEPREEETVVEIVEEKEIPPELVRQVEVFENTNIYFDFDKSNLKPEALEVLKAKAAFLREHPSYSVLIAGNCDNRGTEEYNLALGERRADAAKQYLIALGISGDRIRTVSYGELRPADPRNNEEAWALNRRDTFKLFR
ncbi:MAG: peptidoglycan-associated lipoprotein Pal [Deltaproteobacteria bacterium]|nr:peptidoglycan-associated lipoprotein Pal [Deltaproteobacteria bacterium]MBW2048923.1 peptidoglycan-associated lipoprotein Pal [Deltaproteobacteria bacterium]MBW2110834.1 peptidoglycan-associated lipoprotein Pal [Deltaproteobacteria bacterium]MBW2352373.1 peptidoglycan-associated lipoprotein Pal [Deltaproteobacteria bacterium]HDZ90172.1 peptidoglycan-associated lipoprotein Pal [Deltaproteobacteria bacterium]